MALSGIGKIVVMDMLHQKLPIILTAIVLWLGYYFYRAKKEKALIKYWGLSISNAKPLF